MSGGNLNPANRPGMRQVYYPPAHEWMVVSEAAARSGMSATDIRSRCRAMEDASENGKIDWVVLFNPSIGVTYKSVSRAKNLTAFDYNNFMAVMTKRFPVIRI